MPALLLDIKISKPLSEVLPVSQLAIWSNALAPELTILRSLAGVLVPIPTLSVDASVNNRFACESPSTLKSTFAPSSLKVISLTVSCVRSIKLTPPALKLISSVVKLMWVLLSPLW